jgi:hypothetical protein
MKELAELKALIDGAKEGQLRARNELAKRLVALGFNLYGNMTFPHPSYEEGAEVHIFIQSCYGLEENQYLGFFQVETRKRIPHECDEECDRCEQEWDFIDRRPASAREVIAVLAKALEKELSAEQEEETRDWQLAKGLPTEEELAKARRRIEDHIRKNPRDVPAVAKLLKIL